MGVDADRFAGCLIGQCLGDALGFVVEGQAPAVCRLYVDGVLKGLAPLTKGRGPFPIGQYSDDSQLARELLQSYVARRGFDPANYAHRVAAIFSEGRIVGRGRATEQAAERLAAGVPWDEAGTPPPSAGNGSAMRAGPGGLLYFDEPDALIAAAHDQGRITHADPRCSAGAIAIAGAVALALDDAPIDPAPFLGKLAAWCERIEPSFADWLRRLEDYLTLEPKKAVELIQRAGLEGDAKTGWWGISPFVVPSVLWSLYAFLRTPDDYWETVCTAIRVGGDVDTTAAMAGAISGARLGLAALPAEFTRRLTDQGTWGYDELVALAKECYAIKMSGGEATP
jgi:ADP-ribosylglycohydrolase